MDEATRRRELAEALSAANMQALCITAEKARLKLLSRVYGGSELAVFELMSNIEKPLAQIQEFDDRRTEN